MGKDDGTDGDQESIIILCDGQMQSAEIWVVPCLQVTEAPVFSVSIMKEYCVCMFM